MLFEVCGEPIIGPEYLVPLYPVDDKFIMPDREEIVMYKSPPCSGDFQYPPIKIVYGGCMLDSRKILLADFS